MGNGFHSDRENRVWGYPLKRITEIPVVNCIRYRPPTTSSKNFDWGNLANFAALVIMGKMATKIAHGHLLDPT